MRSVAADAAGLVGAMDAKLSPRDVQPQKPRAEASQIARKTAGNAKDANGRRRIARACGHSVALFDLRALIEGQGLLRDINPDPGAFRHVGASGALLRGQTAALPAWRRGGQAPGPRQQRTEQQRCDRPLPCFCHARAPFALVLQPYAPSVSDMPCADGYVSHKKAARASKEARAAKESVSVVAAMPMAASMSLVLMTLSAMTFAVRMVVMIAACVGIVG